MIVSIKSNTTVVLRYDITYIGKYDSLYVQGELEN